MDHALETSTERLRDHLRRPHAGQRNHLTEDAAYTVNLTDPSRIRALQVEELIALMDADDRQSLERLVAAVGVGELRVFTGQA
ncbi:hypothetical protein H7J82_15680 [Mycolicibacterium poriferae]|uniref:hypothetical protein n=4 Tax=Mycolicibacterium poriferae TaxID=39694 RepID=UPI0021F38615|nr:hypothetical protein [Mycolicibacterium poriferae]MCV7264455.1 hypothetical protein [Mycolicibacterium poriferae]